MAQGTDGPGEAQAEAIPVGGLRTTFFWPLALDLPPVTDTGFWQRRSCRDVEIGEFCDEQIKAIGAAPWTRLLDPLAHLGGGEAERLSGEDGGAWEAARADALSEFAYFHDFVQHFLFRPQADGGSEPFHLYQRRDLARLSVRLRPGHGDDGDRRFDLAVERVRLYVFRIGVAVLAVEVATGADPQVALLTAGGSDGSRRPLHLADVLDLNDRLRRVYAPYHPPEGDGFLRARAEPHLVPLAVSWRDAAGAVLLDGTGDRTPDQRIAQLWTGENGERFIPPFRHWGGLLPEGWAVGAAGSRQVSWRQIFDERMPLLSWVSVTARGPALPEAHYARIRRGDWMRLCFVDDSGQAPYPYDPAFLRGFEAENVYDRFHDVPPAPGEERGGRTRFLISGYALVAVGCGGFFDYLVVMHMRRHYFQMALLLHFELAALLSISGRISRAMADYEDEAFDPKSRLDAERNLADRLQVIERDFLQFVHRFRFTGVSNQLQAGEMFDLMRARMRLPAIYADIKDEITTATGFLSTRASARQAEAAGRLSVVATLGLVLGLPMAFLGMNVLTSSDFFGKALSVSQEHVSALPLHAFVVGLVMTVAFAAARLLTRDRAGPRRHRDEAADTLERLLRLGFRLSGAVTLAAFALACAVAALGWHGPS